MRHLVYIDVTIAGKGNLTNLASCSAPITFEKGRFFIVPHLLWHVVLMYDVSSERPPRISTGFDFRYITMNLTDNLSLSIINNQKTLQVQI